MDTVKFLEKCEVYDETNGGSGHDPKLYILNFCELMHTAKYLSLCLKSYISTVLSDESTKIFV